MPRSAAADGLSLLGSYYPLYPPQEDVAIDYEHFYAHAQLPVTPDVFVAPSELRYFVKVGFGSAVTPKHQTQCLTSPSGPPPLLPAAP